MKVRIIGIVLLLFLATHTFAKVEVRSKQITMADGLANSTVRHFMQDSKGFIWMGTFNGLNRYDGNSFVTYYPSIDNSLALADRKVYDVVERNGLLWIYLSTERHSCYELKSASFVDFTGCGEFAERYDARMFASNGDTWLWHDDNGARRVIYQDGVFRSITYKVQQGNLPSNTVNFIAEGDEGVIWIGTNRGLVCVEGEKNTLVNSTESFYQMVTYQGNTYFCSTTGKIFIYDTSSSRLVSVARLSANDVAITGNLIWENEWIILTRSGVFGFDLVKKETRQRPDFLGENINSANIIIDNKGNYWVYNYTGRMWYLNVQTGEKKVFHLIPREKLGHIDSERYSVVHDSRNIIWISTYGNGLYAYDIVNDELTHFTAGMDGFSHISSNYLLGVMEDRSGEIWVSVEFEGVSRITVLNEGARRYFPEHPNLLDRSNTIRMVSHVNEDEVWIATRRGGLYIYDLDFNLKHARKDLHSNIYAAVKDGQGKVWLGSRGNGLCIDNVWYQHSSTDPTSLGNNNIFQIYKDSQQRMWVCTFGGGLDVPIKKENGYVFRHFFTDNYNQRQTRSLCEDMNGRLWLGTSSGVYIFHPDSLMENANAYHHYNHGKGKLRSNEIKFIFTDSRGKVWIATSGAGVSVCTPEDDYDALQFQHYDIEDGLCNNVVQSIAEDRQGNIWLATEYGISKFVCAEQLFENYFFSTYTHGNVYTESSVSQCDNGDIIFGSNYGFVVFNPDRVKKTSMSFPVVFSNINVNGINMLPGDADSPLIHSLAYSDGVTLKHNQNSVVIDFSSFNYSDAGQTKYSYMLDNYDKAWSAPSTLNFAAYKMLPPGKYTLLVKSSNSSGVWNEAVSSFFIHIKPPVYLTAWAFLLYTLFIVSALWFTYRVTMKFYLLNNKIAVEKQLTEYKLVFFTNISHEFRTPLTLIQGALERIRRIEGVTKGEISYPLHTLEKSTRRMMRLIDQLLEFRKMQNNKLALSLEKTDVVAMLYEIFLSFEDMAESKNMDFQFVPSVTSHKMYIDKGKLDKITYNLLSNAFKYTPQGGRVCLYVNINEERELLEIQVTDTGVGIPRDKRNELFNRFMQSSFSGDSVGVGLHLTHELVTVHQGEIKYDENPGGGSVFTVVLPLGEQAYEEKDFLVPTNLLTQDRREPILIEATDKTLESFIKPNPLNKQKVLVIEDDNDVRQYLQEELSAYFEVVIADNGVTGFQIAQDTAPDLIVCDVLMPGMNGYEVTRKLKSDFNTSHIPVILLTALTLPENHLEGIESGADAYLSKPFSIRLLLTRIVKLLEQREKLKEKFSEEPGIVRSAIYASERDKEFVEQLHRILVENIGNSQFSVDEFAARMSIGRTVFYKKVKGVTGYSPNEYLRIMRMKKAAELLLQGNLTVSEVSYKVGIDDPFYFSKCFKAQFGIAPSAYQKGK